MTERVKLIEERPTEAEIARAAWKWRNDKDRETDGTDDLYFRRNWQRLPGLLAYVDAEVAVGAALRERSDGE